MMPTRKSTNLELLNRLKSVECPDSTYQPATSPLVFSRAKGSLIWDVEGREYVDLSAGFGALPLGHASEAMVSVTKEFAEERPIVDHAMGDVYPSESKIRFLETLREMMPSRYTHGALALSGGQSVEIALKTAMLASKKSGFIAFENAYHGLDLGVLPLTAREDFRAPFKEWLAEDHVIRLPYGADREIVNKAVKKLGRHGLAAIIAEPMQGRAGVHSPPPGWLSMLGEVSHEHGGFLILDEIFTGFGRIGSLSSAEEANADISCFGKAIGGGFPISACFARREIMNAWPESPGEAIHTGTFFGHPFSAEVGVRTLRAMRDQNLARRSEEVGAKARSILTRELSHSPLVKEIRGKGLFIGIEYHQPGFAAKLMDSLRSEGVIVLPSGNTGSVLSLTPALNIPEAVLEKGLDRVIALSK